MVSPVYLFIGQDSLSKDISLKKLKQEFLNPQTEQFNLDTLHAKDLSLALLQERLLCLPAKAKIRMVVVKGAQELKEESKEFILNYVKNPYPKVILVLDMERYDFKDIFIKQAARYAKTLRFREEPHLNVFSLSRCIDQKRSDYALRVLDELFKKGERAERILGGLRYAWEKDTIPALERKKRLKAILHCDIDIKTGRLKPGLAIEKLIVSLSCLKKSFG